MRSTWIPKCRRAAAVLGCLALLGTNLVRGDEFDSLRGYWLNQLTGTNNSASTLNSVANTANNYWSTMNTNVARTNLWSDDPFGSDSSHITDSFRRLRAMALGWATPGCSLYGNSNLVAAVTDGLDWMVANVYTSSAAEYGNWWDWEIGAPQAFNDAALLVYPALSGTQLTNYFGALDYFSPPTRGWSDGANLSDKAKVILIRAIMGKDSGKMTYAQTNLNTVFPFVTSGDGYYVDGSFVYHSRFAYNGGYGRTLVGDVAQLVNLLQGSTWQITDPNLPNVFAWVTNSIEPVIYRGLMMSMVQGRGITSQGDQEKNNGTWAINAVLPVGQFGSPAFGAALTNWSKSPTMPPSHYTFASMDRVVHVGQSYCVGVSMSSSRIANYESILNENLHGWYTGDGMTYLYNNDLQQYVDSFWPTANPYRLAGITVDAGLVRADGSGQGYLSPNPWTGGATLGTCGAAGMQLKSYGCSLVAKKSWFLFDDEIVCLGAGITSTDSRTIESVVEHRQLADNGGGNVFTVNGALKPATLGWSETMSQVNWAHLAGRAGGDDVGYYFPQPTTLKGLREARTGTWAAVQTGSSTNPVTRNYLTLWVDHGTNPVNATYAYVLLPNFSAWQVANYAAAPPVVVLANTPSEQAVQQTALGLTAANFWTDGAPAVGGISVDHKACVLVKNDGTFLDVALSDPTQTNTGSLNLSLNTSASAVLAADAGVTVTQTSPTIQMAVGVAGAAGKTFHVRFYLAGVTNTTLGPVADTFVYDGSPTANYGTSPTTAVKKATTGSNRQSYLQFDLSALPSGTVGGASLGLFCTYANLPGVHALAPVNDNSWGETTLTWSNQPAGAWGADAATWTAVSNAAVSVNVSSAVTSALSAGSNLVSFGVHAITQTSDGFVSYATRENSTVANRPQLQVVYIHNPPSVVLTNPAADTVLSQPAPLTLGASASSPNGAIVQVAFYDAGQWLGTATNSPYGWALGQLSVGNHQFSAVATDALGLSSTSAPVAVTVGGPPVAATTNVVTTSGTPVEVDLSSLVSNLQIPAPALAASFTVGGASNGTVVLLADGHTARFTPSPGYSGPALFTYTATNAVEDGRLLLHYNLQGHTADVSGKGRDGLLDIVGTGAASYTNDVPVAVAAWLSQSLSLTEQGSSGAAKLDRMLITTNELNFQTANWAVTGWFKRANNNNLDLVFHLGTGSGSSSVNELELRFDSGANTLRLLNYNSAGGNDVNLSTTVNPGVWCQFSVTRSGGTLALYINGALVGSDTGFSITTDPAGPLSFGGNGTSSSNTDRWFNGQLADLAVWTSPPTAFEITRLASNTDVSHLASAQGASAAVNVQVSIQTTPTPVWNGGSPVDAWWSDSANWNGYTLVTSNSLFFDGSNRLNNTNDTPAGTFYTALSFNANAGAFVLNGNPISLGTGITNNAATAQTLNLGVSFGNGSTNLTLAGGNAGLTLGGGLTNTLGAPGYTLLNLAGRGTVVNLLNTLNTPGGTNTLTVLSNANWTLLDNPLQAPMSVPWAFVVNGTWNIGSDTSAPVLNTTAPNVLGVSGVSYDSVGTLAGSVASLNVTNGNLMLASSRLYVASTTGATGIVNVAGGALNVRGGLFGAPGNGTNALAVINVSGGLLNLGTTNGSTAQSIYLAQAGTGKLNLSGSGTVTCVTLDVSSNQKGNTLGSVGTVNLDGGALVVNTVTNASSGPQAGLTNGTAATFYFNGGTLRARGTGTTVFQGSLANPALPIKSFVKAGGAVLDSQSFVLSMGEALQHDPALGTTPDGGLTKLGSGKLLLRQPCTYTGPTLVTQGTLVLTNSGSLANSASLSLSNGAVLDVSGLGSPFTLGSGQTLTGSGLVNGPLVLANGAALMPGPAIATLTFSSKLSLNNGSTTILGLNRGLSPSNATAQVSGTVSYGGTLVVTNLGAGLQAGDSFRLFVAGSYAGAFTNIIYPSGYVWTNTLALDGSVSVLSTSNTSVVTQATVNYSLAGNQLTLSWSAAQQGWILQCQTNALGQGLGTNWFDLTNSASLTSTNITLDPTIPGMFFRLRRP